MNKPCILVVGGAGFIGSHMSLLLQENNYTPIVLDKDDCHLPVIAFKGELHNSILLQSIFNKFPISAVLHFASFIQVNDSIRKPDHYYENNVISTLSLLKVMRQYQVNKIIYSSSAAIYGKPIYHPIDETHPCQPINPYGWTKLMNEQILADYASAYGLEYISLRYFNAAGADPLGRVRESHQPETHLIPLIIQAALQHQPFNLYGNDYSTPDGTCIRDYIHVSDICTAHLAALNHILNHTLKNKAYNLGYGKGYSVLEVINMVNHLLQCKTLVRTVPRREGDVELLIANPQRALTELNWQPQYNDLKIMISHAINALIDNRKIPA